MMDMLDDMVVVVFQLVGALVPVKDRARLSLAGAAEGDQLGVQGGGEQGASCGKQAEGWAKHVGLLAGSGVRGATAQPHIRGRPVSAPTRPGWRPGREIR